ncbi:MAG: cupredoxin domain-containing protein [Gemmatimonadaceae bacterium]|uniref:cupredoxin domain-containing protein n=1 Tax=Gemmatimonas sp. UBA7669 TaxID=1946568 RepID=UPI0025BF045A|nr:cupredoxin domain-containing protein [Gemmatimonas sp. UBA7669]MBX9854865.1 cupredoxin domain-containing protein [Gemmatimonadaceae bacterium]
MPFSLGGIDWFVIAAAGATIVWVNWYFFAAERAPATATAGPTSGAQEVTIAVHGGYTPSTIRVRAGSPVRLLFDRQETSSCSEEVVFGDFGIRTYLPAHETTAVTVTPPKPGVYEFTCGMSMLRGKLVAE